VNTRQYVSSSENQRNGNARTAATTNAATVLVG
jgi:hypothetical protein